MKRRKATKTRMTRKKWKDKENNEFGAKKKQKELNIRIRGRGGRR